MWGTISPPRAVGTEQAARGGAADPVPGGWAEGRVSGHGAVPAWAVGGPGGPGGSSHHSGSQQSQGLAALRYDSCRGPSV